MAAYEPPRSRFRNRNRPNASDGGVQASHCRSLPTRNVMRMSASRFGVSVKPNVTTAEQAKAKQRLASIWVQQYTPLPTPMDIRERKPLAARTAATTAPIANVGPSTWYSTT